MRLKSQVSANQIFLTFPNFQGLCLVNGVEFFTSRGLSLCLILLPLASFSKVHPSIPRWWSCVQYSSAVKMKAVRVEVGGLKVSPANISHSGPWEATRGARLPNTNVQDMVGADVLKSVLRVYQ